MEEVKMKSEFLILDSDYLDWVKELSARYRKSQIKAAVKVNQEMLRFYWELGKDIVKLNAENKYGSNFYTVISTDLKRLVPNASGLSPSNIRYAKRFFELYSSTYTNFQQLAEKSETNLSLSEKMLTDLFSVPWGHSMHLNLAVSLLESQNMSWKDFIQKKWKEQYRQLKRLKKGLRD